MKRTRPALLAPAVLAVALLAAGLDVPASAAQTAGGSFLSGSYSNAHGTRAYRLYVPDGWGNQRTALVVMLHGCTQTADDFAAGTEMNAIAERDTFMVLYPEQEVAANAGRCWNWFEPAHQARGTGEPAILAGLTRDVIARYRVDASRAYVAGMSAGGAMAAILGATYPDVFAAIGVSAGLEYRAAGNLAEAAIAQETGGPDPNRQGQLAYAAAGSTARIVPTIVFHGQNDLTVAVVNGHQVLSQWAQTNDLADDGRDNGSIDDRPEQTTPGRVPNGHAYTRFVYNDARGAPLMEKWIVETMTHKWSGGSTAGSYTDPAGPDASDEMWRFFRQQRVR